jgi:hypothetical protein
MEKKYEAVIDALREIITEHDKAVKFVNAHGVAFPAGLSLACERGKDALAQVGG